MKRHPLLLVGILALGAIALGGCGKNRDLEYKNVQIKELERRNAELEAQLAQAQTMPQPGGAPVTAGSGNAWESSPDINVGTREQDVVLSISNEVLFKPGSAVLSDRAKKVLDGAISKIQSSYPDADVRVEGHTDNEAIRRSKDEHKDNWDLAGNRAQAVLHYLLNHGVASSKLGFAGYGMERPLTSNSSDSAKAKNRRVEIVVIKNAHKPVAP